MAHATKADLERLQALMDEAGFNPPVGSCWYPISADWWHSYKVKIEQDNDSAQVAEEIDNTGLEDKDFPGFIRRDAQETDNFVWMPQEAVNLLTSWGYRLVGEFPRYVIPSGQGSNTRIETFPQPVVLRSSQKDADTFLACFSRTATPAQVLDKVASDPAIRAALKLPEALGPEVLRSCIRAWHADFQGARERRAMARQSVGSPLSSSQQSMAEDTKEEEDDVEVPLEEALVPFVSSASSTRGAATVDEVAKNDASTVLYIELRDNATGAWPRGPWYAAGFEACPRTYDDGFLREWRASTVKEGAVVDAQGSKEGEWVEAVVVELKPFNNPAATKSSSGVVGKVFGHFGFGTSSTPTSSSSSSSSTASAAGVDHEVTVRTRGSATSKTRQFHLSDVKALAPLHAHTRPWRQGIRVGDVVDFGKDAATEALPHARTWRPALVVAIDHSVLPPALTLRYTDFVSTVNSFGEVVRFTPKPDSETVTGVSLEDSSFLFPKGSQISTRQASLLPPGAMAPTYPDAPVPLATASWVTTSYVAPKYEAAAAGATSSSSSSSSSSGGGLLSSLLGRNGVSTRAQTQAQENAVAIAAADAGDWSQAIEKQGKFLADFIRNPDPSKPFRNPGLMEVTPIKEYTGRNHPGLCGLDNLGNTCFMNSLLQCVSNTMELTDYFVSNEYLRDVNVQNPLGSQGNLAHAYGALMHAMWSGLYGRVSPGVIKQIVARKASQFIGWGQQDSQEFASFLLDLLLEDLCRIKKKPYVPLIEDSEKENKPDNEIAERYWSDHKKRNDSKITDIFAGQYKSRVKCNQCGTTSLAFDPFTSLTVPIPVEKFQGQDVFYFGLDNQRPIRATYYWLPSDIQPTGQDVAEWLVQFLARFWEDPNRAVTNDDIVISPATVLKNREKAQARREALLRRDSAGAAAAPAAAGAGAGKTAAMEEDGSDDPTSASSASAASVVSPAFVMVGAGTKEEVTYVNGHRLPHPWEVLHCLTGSRPCVVHGVVPHWAVMTTAMAITCQARGLQRLDLMVYHVPNNPSYKETEEAGGVPIELHPEYEEWVLDDAGGAGAAPAADSDDDDDDGAFFFNNPARPPKRKPAAAPGAPVRRRRAPPASPIGPLRDSYAIVWFRKRDADAYGTKAGLTTGGDSLIVPLKWMPTVDAFSTSDDAAPAAAPGAPGAEESKAAAPVKLTGICTGRNLPADGEGAMTMGEFREATFRSFFRFVHPQHREQVSAYNLPGVSMGFVEYPYENRNKVWHEAIKVPNQGQITLDPGSTPLGHCDKDSQTGMMALHTRQYLLDLPSERESKLFLPKEGGETVTPPFYGQGPSRKGISLADCLKRFSVEEQLSEDNKWRCPKCKEEVRAYKKMSVWRLPPVLIVHLKRFLYQKGGWGAGSIKGKIEDLVEFPLENLDMRDYVEGPIDASTGCIYDLFAVSEHSGGLGGGHYTAHCFNTRTRKWFSFNDSSVHTARPKDCVRSSAYVLFYRRRKPGSPHPSLLAAGLPRAVMSIAGSGDEDEAEEGAGTAAAPKAEEVPAAGAGGLMTSGTSGGLYNDFDTNETDVEQEMDVA